LTGLEELAGKYRRLGELKRLPRTSDPIAWRSAMRDLASRFPGALKELEKLPLELVDQRASEGGGGGGGDRTGRLA